MEQKPSPSSNRTRVRCYLRWLMATYPAAFAPRRTRPLAVGIYEQLLADPARPSWASEIVVRQAIARWTKLARYRRAVEAGKSRRALDGSEVSSEQA